MKRTKPDLGRVARIAKHVELRSVSCREVSGKRLLELADMPTKGEWSATHDASGHREMDAGQIVVVVRFSAHLRDGNNAGSRMLADVKAAFSLRYAVPQQVLSALDQEAVQEFAETNGIYNAWPYWRELLQNTAARVGLPGVVAPVFRHTAEPTKTPDKVES